MRLSGLPAYAASGLYADAGGTAVSPTELQIVVLAEHHWNGWP